MITIRTIRRNDYSHLYARDIEGNNLLCLDALKELTTNPQKIEEELKCQYL